MLNSHRPPKWRGSGTHTRTSGSAYDVGAVCALLCKNLKESPQECLCKLGFILCPRKIQTFPTFKHYSEFFFSRVDLVLSCYFLL